MNELFSLFMERKDSFLQSLKRTLSVISSDEFLNKMFEDKLSSIYIPDRVIELIKTVIYDKYCGIVLQY